MMTNRYVVCVGHYPRCECTGVTNAIARAVELHREPLSGAEFRIYYDLQLRYWHVHHSSCGWYASCE